MTQNPDEVIYTDSSGHNVTARELEERADEFASLEFDDDQLDDLSKRTSVMGRPRLGDGPSELIAFRVDPEIARRLKEFSDAENRSSSDIIREALDRFLDAS